MPPLAGWIGVSSSRTALEVQMLLFKVHIPTVSEPAQPADSRRSCLKFKAVRKWRSICFKRPVGVAVNGATSNCGIIESSRDGGRGGVSLKHSSLLRAVHILVIEDNSSDVYLLDRALHRQDLGFELTHLANGNQALEFIRQEGPYAKSAVPDLILVDLNLSKHRGEDLLREIRGARRLDGVPLCVWSSSRSPVDGKLLKELGVSRFITKPTGLDKFMEIGKIIKDVLLQASQAA
jgi:two-component system, chemotaxis family, response regulator Rcp1